MFPRNENRNEGTFACCPGTKTGTRVHSPKPPFYETALLSPGDSSRETKDMVRGIRFGILRGVPVRKRGFGQKRVRLSDLH